MTTSPAVVAWLKEVSAEAHKMYADSGHNDPNQRVVLIDAGYLDQLLEDSEAATRAFELAEEWDARARGGMMGYYRDDVYANRLRQKLRGEA